jgi:hypothetical protein
MMEEPQYIKISTDADSLYDADVPGGDDVLFVPTDQIVTDPVGRTDDGSVYLADYDEDNVARATLEERFAWSVAHHRFSTEYEAAEAEWRLAEAAYEKAKERLAKSLTAAWEGYRSTQEAIGQRIEEVQELREAAYQAEQQRIHDKAIADQVAEDAELGPRTWAVWQNTETYGAKKPDMMVPMLHLAGCSVLRGREDVKLSYRSDVRRLRIAEAHEILLTGGPEMARAGVHGYGRTGRYLHTKLCGRCKPHDSLREELGEVFDGWLYEVESVQPPLPTEKKVLSELTAILQPWFFHDADEGFTMASDEKYREAGRIEPFETLVGWGSAFTAASGDRRRSLAESPEKLAEIEEILPKHGWAVRRFIDIWDKKNDVECITSVAVRKMTKAEIRARKAGQ